MGGGPGSSSVYDTTVSVFSFTGGGAIACSGDPNSLDACAPIYGDSADAIVGQSVTTRQRELSGPARSRVVLPLEKFSPEV